MSFVKSGTYFIILRKRQLQQNRYLLNTEMKMIDFTQLGINSLQKQINPRDIFMGLSSKSQKYQYPRDVQGEVWKQWFEQRNDRDTIIKMNTGSGKTVVALMIL